MIKFIKNLFKKNKPVKMVMFWNGKEAQHWRLTKEEYNHVMSSPLPAGIYILSEMDL
jgi:hypothetical protein